MRRLAAQQEAAAASMPSRSRTRSWLGRRRRSIEQASPQVQPPDTANTGSGGLGVGEVFAACASYIWSVPLLSPRPLLHTQSRAASVISAAKSGWWTCPKAAETWPAFCCGRATALTGYVHQDLPDLYNS